ncbi:MAG: glycosyltransferase [Lachnospiraceae bacterium]|nr:glycosyltransferase [Lachnospiraceae bacterium]
MESVDNITVDVVIPVYKPDVSFKKVTKRLKLQTVKPNSIILLETIGDEDYDALSVAERKEVFEEEIPVIKYYISKSEFDHGNTRAFGMDMTSAPYVLLMTQDALPADKYLIERLYRTFETGDNNAISYARQLPRKEADILESLTRKHNYPKKSQVKSAKDIESMGIKAFFCSDVCAMYDKEKYYELGGFEEKTIFNEDAIIASKALDKGYTVTYEADARVYHSHSYTLKQQFTRNFDLGVSHKLYSDIFSRVSSEKEGGAYAKNVIKTLLKKGKVITCFYFCLQCGFKLFGYKFGKNYNKLPKKLVKKMAMNKSFFD